MVVFSFALFLVGFIVVGILSVTQSQKTSADYLVAGRSVPPWLVGLSAVATNNSGYMFTGMIGFTYVWGWSSIWLMIGWLIGDFCGSTFIHKNLREASERTDSHSFSGVLATWNGTEFRKFRMIAGLISVLFLGAYSAAQFNAGSKALHVLFGWDLSTGAIIGSVMVLIYCFSGGIRASIWTDAAQSFVMLASMGLMLVVAVMENGGLQASWTALAQVEPGYMNWIPKEMAVPGLPGAILFIAGWMFAGFGVVGQPHVMIRFMAVDDVENVTKARAFYYGWFAVFYALTIGVGLMARLFIPSVENFDAELALPMLSMELLPPVLVGLMLAGLFAATISTADSLVLSCSASLTRDFFRQRNDHFWIPKIGTVVVTVLALVIALSGNKSVFRLVLDAWAVLAGAFGPLLAVYCFKQKPNELLATLMLVIGVATVFIWKALGWSEIIYEIAPAILMGFVVFFVGKQLRMTLDQK